MTTGSAFPDSLRDELAAAIVRGDQKIARDFVRKASREEAYALFRDRSKLYTVIEDIALNEKAPAFERLIDIYRDDPLAVQAILSGFKRDEKFNSQSNYDDRFGPSPDHADLEKKRAALINLVFPSGSGSSSKPAGGYTP